MERALQLEADMSQKEAELSYAFFFLVLLTAVYRSANSQVKAFEKQLREIQESNTTSTVKVQMTLAELTEAKQYTF